MRVAVIGAGVAGSFLSYLLSTRKIDCLIYDGRPPREKPCGGGCTAKITQRYPIFPAATIPGNQIYDLYYQSSRHNSVHLRLREPIWIYSRFELDGHLRDLAVKQGARFVPGRATSFEQESGSWLVRDSNGGAEKFDFLVGADGATSIVRKRLAGPFDTADLSTTLGYYVPLPTRSDAIHIRFLDPHLDGYLWSFPRVDHASVGIISSYRVLSSSELKDRLHLYLKDLYGIEDTSNLTGYSAPVPTLSRQTLERLKVGDSNWALIGDAAGFADPVTAEGIAYAMRSAELLAAFLAEGRPEKYAAAWREDFGVELLQAAKLKHRFYRGNLAGETFINRMLRLTRDSVTVQKAQNDLIAGHLNYKQLAKRLLVTSPKILYEVCRAKLTDSIVP